MESILCMSKIDGNKPNKINIVFIEYKHFDYRAILAGRQ